MRAAATQLGARSLFSRTTSTAAVRSSTVHRALLVPPAAPRHMDGMQVPQRHLAAALAAPDATGTLLTTCAVMLLGAYACGTLPLLARLPAAHMAVVNSAGAGLLMGSALWVIIPEGWEAAKDAGSPSGLAAVATLLLGYLAMYALDQVAHRWQSSRHPQQPHQQQYHTCPGEDTPCRQTSCPTTPKGAAAAAVRGPRDHSPSFSGWGRSPASLPGVSHSPGASISPSRRDPEHASSTTSRGSSPRHSAARDRPGHVVVISGPRPQQLDYTDKQQQQQQSVAVGSRERPEQQQESGGAMDRTWSDDGKPRQGKAAGPSAAQAILPGLCIHAAADGIAVGSAALSPQAAVSLAVAVAMVVHKGPVAMGLGLTLQGSGWSWSASQKGLLLFAAMSPVSALATYALLRSMPQLSSEAGLAGCILLSGGTVLYASTHALLSLLRGLRGSGDKAARWVLAAAYVGGFLAPKLLFALVHDHAHAHGHGHHEEGAHHHDHDDDDDGDRQ